MKMDLQLVCQMRMAKINLNYRLWIRIRLLQFNLRWHRACRSEWTARNNHVPTALLLPVLYRAQSWCAWQFAARFQRAQHSDQRAQTRRAAHTRQSSSCDRAWPTSSQMSCWCSPRSCFASLSSPCAPGLLEVGHLSLNAAVVPKAHHATAV